MSVLGLDLDWAGVGALVTAAIALVALFIAAKELRSARETAAEQIYKEFLIQSLQYPKFIYPDSKEIDVDKEQFAKRRDKFWQYEVYIDLMLTAFEQLFILDKDNEKLARYMGGYLYSHEKYLTSKYFESNFAGEMENDFWLFAKKVMAAEKQKWD